MLWIPTDYGGAHQRARTCESQNGAAVDERTAPESRDPGKKYRSRKGEQGKIAPNVLKLNFRTTRPNEKWVTDVTEFTVAGQKLYLLPIIDLFNGEVISHVMSAR